MNILLIITTFFKIIGTWIDIWTEKNKEIKQKKQEALNEVQQGLKDRDPSLITSGFDKLRRM